MLPVPPLSPLYPPERIIDTFSNSWFLKNSTLTPTASHLQSLCSFYESRNEPDALVTFRFPAPTPPLFIHESRLLHAGGPLAVLVSAKFRESTERLVNLSDEDDPDSFAVIRAFLYACPVKLGGRHHSTVFRMAAAAHRWQLDDLLQGICEYAVAFNLLYDQKAILSAVPVVALPAATLSFADVFWKLAGLFFTAFARVDTKATSADVGLEHFNVRECPGFPGIWDLALSQSALPRLWPRIARECCKDIQAQLLDFLMTDLEQRIEDDDTILKLLEMIPPTALRQHYLLDGARDELKDCSRRALRLLARSLLEPSHGRAEAPFSRMADEYCAIPEHYLGGLAKKDRIARRRRGYGERRLRTRHLI